MDKALVPQSHIDRLPEELLLDIINQPCLSDLDLISLARTNRRNYRVGISLAYTAHFKQNHGLAIYWAIENARHATLERLIKSGVDVNMYSETFQMATDKFKSTKAHIDFHPRVRATPLAWAASHGQDSTVESLLDNGADIERKSYGLCNCSYKSRRCWYRCWSHRGFPLPPRLKFLEDDDVDDHIDHDDSIDVISPRSPLHHAICNGHVSTAKLLLERGAEVLCVGSEGPAILVATRVGLNKIVDYLMDHCAVDVNFKNYMGITPLHVAYVSRKYDLVAKYLKRGADINVTFPGRSGPWNIFAMACAEGDFSRAMGYLENGADPRIVIKDRLQSEHRSDQYTPLRLIWQHEFNAQDIAGGRLDSAMRLEQEIIGRSNADPPVNEEKQQPQSPTGVPSEQMFQMFRELGL